LPPPAFEVLPDEEGYESNIENIWVRDDVGDVWEREQRF